MDNADLAALQRGTVVKRVLLSQNARAVALLGAVSVNGSIDSFIRQFRDIARFRKGEAVTQIAEMRTPTLRKDLEPLLIPPADLDDLATCRVGNCAVELSENMIGRLCRDVDWSAAGARNRTASLVKDMLADRVLGLLSDGAAMLGEYSDKARPLVVADEFNAVLSGASVLLGHVPELQRYLREFPLVDLPGAETFVYWSNEHLGFKPVISLTHVVIYHRVYGAIPVAYVVSRDLYSSHYINASIGLTIAVGTRSDGLQGFTLIYVNRSRIDVLGGMLGGLKRWLIEKRARGEIEKRVRLTKARLEAPVQPFYHEPESLPGRYATLLDREPDISR